MGSFSAPPLTTARIIVRGAGYFTGDETMKRWTLSYLESLDTLAVGQTCDLKIDTGETRVWLCRCGVDDGMPYDDQVTVEELRGGRWETVDQYDPRRIAEIDPLRAKR